MQNISGFANEISFKLIQPYEPIESVTRGLQMAKPYHPASELYTRFEIANTVLPVSSERCVPGLLDLLRIPRMSTLAIGSVVNKAVELMPSDQTFLNVGVWNGYTLLAGMLNNGAKRCVGVDNFSQFGGPRHAFLQRFDKWKQERHSFYNADYVEYFHTLHCGEIGVYIYDGDHSYDNQLTALRLAEPFLADGAIIIVDDTNWDSPRRATEEFMTTCKRNVSMLFDVATCHDSHPTFWNGLMVLQIS